MFGMTGNIRNRAAHGCGTGKSAAGVSLSKLGPGVAAKVKRLDGSPDIVGRLRAMGVLPGVVIVKKSAILGGGPVIAEKGGTQFAVGREMADGIIVEPVKK